MKFAIALLALSNAAGAAPTLTATSYGQIRFGDKVEVVEDRLHERAPAIADADEPHCRQVEFKAYPHVIFMIEDGVITRAEADSPVPTSIGFTVGSSASAIRRKFPSVKIEPHQYEPDGHYLTIATKNGKSAILMEEVGGKITNIRGGLMPSVQYVEGCL